MALVPAVSLEHVGIASASPRSWLSDAVSAAPLVGKVMPSGVAVAHFGPGDQLELLWPGRAGSPIDRFLERRGPGLHHISLRVDVALAGLVEQLAQAGVGTTGPVERSADGRLSVFLHPSHTGGVLVELVEGPRP
jgi:hypothetical protein